MPKIRVNRSILIKAPAEKVYKTISDFNHWGAWSPWLILEPETEFKVEENGKFYSWSGKRIGSGNMKITGEKNNEWVNSDLTFLTPWKSEAKVRMEMKQEGENIKVNWLMDSSLPFFMFWMTKAMTAYIGMDFDRGLYLLKDYTEEGKVHSKLDFKGISDYQGCTYIGLKRETTIDALSNVMKDDFTKVGAFINDRKELVAGNIFTIYHKWDMVNRKVSYTTAIPVKKQPDDLPGDFISGSVPATKIYTLRHTGPYLHLGNAWSAMENMKRSKTFKMNKSIHPFEIYINTPGEVSDNELVTEVTFAVK